jgi:2'-5' RNA ligase
MERHKYLVVLSLPDSLQKELDAIRRQHNPEGYKLSPSHFTVVPPFTTDRSLDQLLLPLETACLKVKPFYLHLMGVDHSFPKEDLLVLKAANPRNLGRLAKHVAMLLRPLMRADGQARVATLLKRPFRPHITLLARTLELDTELEKAISERFTNYVAYIEGVELWKLNEDRWKKVERVCFMG